MRDGASFVEHPQPILVKADFALSPAESSERMDVTVSEAAPVLEFDTEFEGRARARHELSLIDSEPFIEAPQVREGSFPDSDNPDLFRLNKVHFAGTWKQFR
jgi:hypothetical protein